MKTWISRRLFLPRLIDFVFNPVFLIRRPIYLALKEIAQDLKGDVVDYGCGSMPYKALFSSAKSYLGVDLENSEHGLSSPDLVFVNGKLPLADESKDVVVMFEVLDDLKEPEGNLQDIWRVLKPGGLLVLTTSFVWEIHEAPNDYLRYTHFGVKELFRDTDLKPLESRTLGNHVNVAFQMLIMAVYEPLRQKSPTLAILTLPFIAVLNAASVALGALNSNSSRMYHTNLFVLQKEQSR